MLGGRVHIIGSPELMHTLHKHPQTVSFWYLEAKFTTQLGAMTKETAKSFAANLEPNAQEPNIVMMEGLKATHSAMTPQGGMDEMNRVAASVTKTRLDGLIRAIQSKKTAPVDLWEWVQHEITVATTECVYGVHNPYRDPKVEAGFWYASLRRRLTSPLPN
jgi:hypothetical protein